jgi:hypothetical protein
MDAVYINAGSHRDIVAAVLDGDATLQLYAGLKGLPKAGASKAIQVAEETVPPIPVLPPAALPGTELSRIRAALSERDGVFGAPDSEMARLRAGLYARDHR